MPDPPQPSDVLIKPPKNKRLSGRPRKRRIHSRGEVDHAYICSRCKQIVIASLISCRVIGVQDQ
ncbi:hypothetical protein Taro_046474 [Colocasia esculenta]|uniref:Uncharacterized protein n=1 Tax=Colocasia esculenta TaxID=4460 RepID=A0A843WSI9_COLES|nr:hypothetical protein [Colocasia esculenta]